MIALIRHEHAVMREGVLSTEYLHLPLSGKVIWSAKGGKSFVSYFPYTHMERVEPLGVMIRFRACLLLEYSRIDVE